MTDPQEPAPIDRVLERARHVEPEPPEGFVATIMRRVNDLESQRSWWGRLRRARAANPFPVRRLDTGKGAMIMKKVVWGAAVLGAVAIVSVVWLGYPVSGPGTEATVGGAQRSQAASGIDPVQAFVQSDTFDQLMKNKDTRELLQRAVSDASLRGALGEPALARALADPAFQRALAEPAFHQAVRRR
jgi:hypothetical protein